MADQRLPELNPVITPALTDLHYSRQSGDTRDKRETTAQILSLYVEANDLTAAVIWANIPDANVPASAVTQHVGAIDHDLLLNFDAAEHFAQAAISITESQVSDLQAYGFGDVTKVGTPANDQIGVWTGDGTIEGTASLKYDGTNGLTIANTATAAIFIADTAAGAGITFQGSGRPQILNVACTGLVPNICPNKIDLDTGLGLATLDGLSLIAGGKEGIRIQETGAVIAVEMKGVVTLQAGTSALPSLAFAADLTTGFFSNGAGSGVMNFTGLASQGWKFASTTIQAGIAGGAAIMNVVGSATVPTVRPVYGDVDTGIGQNAADQVSIIGGGIELARFVEATSAEQTLILNNDDTSLPDLASLGDPDTGFAWDTANGMYAILGTIRQWNWSSTSYFGQNSDGPLLSNVATSSTVPTICPTRGDILSGLGGTNAGEVHLIANSVTGLTVKELNGGVLQIPAADISVTAFATGGQASAVTLWNSYNVIDVCASTGDSVKLASAFGVGTTVFIKNDGAASCDVFPANGDDLGAGVDTAVAVPAGESISFIGTVASTTWTKLIVAPVGGSGDVTKVGTPVDNQIGVWTGDGTLEGDADFTWAAGVLNVGGPLLMGIAGGPRLQNLQATNLIPTVLPNKSDVDTGVGYDSNDIGTLVAGGKAVANFYELGGHPKLIIDPLDAGTGLPTLVFGSTAAEGFKGGAGNLYVMTGSNSQFRFVGTSFRANLAGGGAIENVAASATVPSIRSNSSDVDSGLGAPTLDQVCLIAGGVEGLRVSEATTITIETFGPVIAPDGTAAAPSYSFSATGQQDVGFYRSGADAISVALGGVAQAHWAIETTGFSAIGSDRPAILNVSASATVPSLTPRNDDANTGIGRGNPDELSLIAGGKEIARCQEVAGAEQFIVSPGFIENNAAAPALAFGDGDTGFFELSDDTLAVSVAGTMQFGWAGAKFVGIDGNSAAINNVAVQYTTPSLLARQSDVNTGIGSGATDSLTLVAGGQEALRVTESATHVIFAFKPNIALTADVGSAQGNGVIVSSINQYSTVANVGDAATLPATFILGTEIHVINDGANSMDVFPASGDDAGAGTDTAVAVAAGARAKFLAVTADATWVTMYNA